MIHPLGERRSELHGYAVGDLFGAGHCQRVPFLDVPFSRRCTRGVTQGIYQGRLACARMS